MTDIIKAFLTGGLICSLVQILLDRTKLMPGRVMVMLVVSGGISSSSWFWKYAVEGCGRKYGRGRLSGNFPGRSDCSLCRDHRRSGIWIFGSSCF